MTRRYRLIVTPAHPKTCYNTAPWVGPVTAAALTRALRRLNASFDDDSSSTNWSLARSRGAHHPLVRGGKIIRVDTGETVLAVELPEVRVRYAKLGDEYRLDKFKAKQ